MLTVHCTVYTEVVSLHNVYGANSSQSRSMSEINSTRLRFDGITINKFLKYLITCVLSVLFSQSNSCLECMDKQGQVNGQVKHLRYTSKIVYLINNLIRILNIVYINTHAYKCTLTRMRTNKQYTQTNTHTCLFQILYIIITVNVICFTNIILLDISEQRERTTSIREALSGDVRENLTQTSNSPLVHWRVCVMS